MGKYGPEKTPYLDTFHAVINYKKVASDTFPWTVFRNSTDSTVSF